MRQKILIIQQHFRGSRIPGHFIYTCRCAFSGLYSDVVSKLFIGVFTDVNFTHYCACITEALTLRLRLWKNVTDVNKYKAVFSNSSFLFKISSIFQKLLSSLGIYGFMKLWSPRKSFSHLTNSSPIHFVETTVADICYLRYENVTEICKTQLWKVQCGYKNGGWQLLTKWTPTMIISSYIVHVRCIAVAKWGAYVIKEKTTELSDVSRLLPLQTTVAQSTK